MTYPVLRTSNNPFWDQGYVVTADLVDAARIGFTRMAMDASLRAGRLQFRKNPVVPGGALNEYSAIGAEVLLLQCQPAIEAIAGCALAPAYARWRIYETGAALLRHVDRDACEISASLAILSDPGDDLWPIHVCDLQGEERAIVLPPGAAIVYQGSRVPHWRTPFHGQRHYQVFLHYVIRDGDQAKHAFDGRSALAIAAETIGTRDDDAL